MSTRNTTFKSCAVALAGEVKSNIFSPSNDNLPEMFTRNSRIPAKTQIQIFRPNTGQTFH